mmetsp:Transcript_14635/g.43332  ORF Transcript_14635/g.43332 Transcript_14635/m.43332 type:complete len:156 (+) Transcript_14635:666-1133(+)
MFTTQSRAVYVRRVKAVHEIGVLRSREDADTECLRTANTRMKVPAKIIKLAVDVHAHREIHLSYGPRTSSLTRSSTGVFAALGTCPLNFAALYLMNTTSTARCKDHPRNVRFVFRRLFKCGSGSPYRCKKTLIVMRHVNCLLFADDYDIPYTLGL